MSLVVPPRKPLDYDSQVLFTRFIALGMTAAEESTVEVARKNAHKLIAFQHDPGDVTTDSDRRIPSDYDDVSVRVAVPHRRQNSDVLVWFHGGGWLQGDIQCIERPCRSIADASGTTVVMVDYSRAPEHPFPRPLLDCITAAQWTYEVLMPELGFDGDLIIGGDSSGGNLAAGVALHARDHGWAPVAAQVLIYPALDTDFERDSYQRYGTGFTLTERSMRYYWAAYLGSRDHGELDVYARPLRAASLEGLPPTLIATAEYDPLRDEGIAFASRLQEAGVAVTFHHFGEQAHSFFSTLASLPKAQRIIDQVASFLGAREPSAVPTRPHAAHRTDAS